MATPSPLGVLKDIVAPRTRGYVYRVLLAALPVLVATGAITGSTVPDYVGLIAAILGVSVAAGNTPTRPPTDPPPP